MKKLLFLINTLEGGGAELVLADTANALSKKYDVTVMTVSGGGVHEKRLCDRVCHKSIVNCKNPFLRKVFSYLVSFVLPASIVHRIFIGNHYDYEIAFLEGVPTKIISAAKTKKYAWVHIDLVNTFGLDKVHRNMDKHIACYKKYDKIICVSETVREAFSKRFGITDNVEVKYNVLNDDLIREKAKQPIDRNDKFRFVSVGRLARQKGYDRLLDVLERLHRENIDFELILVGKGEEYASLKNQAENAGIADIVEFAGFTDNPYKYMQSADLVVFPSRAEGYSTVATEAVILGKPVVVSDCSGMKEIFGDSEYGIITDSDESLYKAIKSMICDSDLREHYANKAFERAKDFSMQSRVNELEKLF